MFRTLKERLVLVAYIFILLTIPVGAYLVSQYQTIKSSAREPHSSPPILSVTTPKTTTSPLQELLNNSSAAVSQNASPSPEASASANPTVATSYGPTLAFKVTLEGSPPDNQATSLFVGIMEGSLTSNPKFLLTFTVDLPASGEYTDISLAGLTPGSQYTAVLKGAAQIATSSAFTMSPAVSYLNNNQPINLTSGDLNDDNIINSADYSLAQQAYGSTPKSSNWNANADFDKDGIVNVFDLAIIAKNIGQIGASGAWVSPIPQVASSSASLNTPTLPIGGPSSNHGYWMWVPK